LTTNLASTGQTNANAITSLQPGGSNTQIQFNDSSSYGGDSDLTWNKTTNILTVNGTGVFDRIGVNDSTPDAMLDITCSSASTKGLIVEGAVGQSENLIEGGNLAHAAPLFKVSADGTVTCKSVALTGTNLVLGRLAISPTIKVADGGNNLNIRNFNASKDINVDIAESGNFFQIRTKDGGTTTTRVQWEDTGKRRDKAASYADIKNNGDAVTITFDLDVANVHQVTLVANRTFALSNPSSGQRFMVRVLQDGTGGRSGIWFSTIKWAGGVPPVQPAAGHANEASLYGFLCVGTNTYDGFVIGTGII
jgi:flagellar basal body rod protein FlgG